jgi:hypothetical protein
MAADVPLILTLQLDETSFAFFNALRQQYFPPERNYLQAHLTLFHHLPAHEPMIQADLETWSSQRSPLALDVTEVKSIGKGVAYKIDCRPLLDLHKQMQQKWHGWLQPQDKQKLWPHITVQNKVPPAEAQKTLATLEASFQPFGAIGEGFSLWSYEGGPWKFIRGYAFRKA